MPYPSSSTYPSATTYPGLVAAPQLVAVVEARTVAVDGVDHRTATVTTVEAR